MSGTDAVALLEILEAGLLTTIQDLGRPGLGALGIPHGGAADPRSLAIANVLVGNAPDAPALECTLTGPTVRVLRATVVAIAGADCSARIVETDETIRPGRSVAVRAGVTIALPGPPPVGLRTYLAVAGGVAVDEVLGSAATLVGSGLGGLDGRALRSGDIVRARSALDGVAPAAWIGPTTLDRFATAREGAVTIRVTPGPDAAMLGDAELGTLAAATWTVDPRSDRMGLRLDGPPLPGSWTGERVTIGLLPGAVQVPPDGRPIALLVEAQPTGGYPVPAVVAKVDLPLLGQLRPGDRVRFEPVSAEVARRALAEDRTAFDEAVAHLRDDARWDDLWRGSAG